MKVFSETDLKTADFVSFEFEYKTIKRDAIKLINECIIQIDKVSYNDVKLYGESITKKIINVVKKLASKLINFVKYVLNGFLKLIFAPFSVQLQFVIKDDETSINDTSEGVVDAIKHNNEFTLNGESIDFSINLINPVPLVEDFINNIRSNYKTKKNNRKDKDYAELEKHKINKLETYERKIDKIETKAIQRNTMKKLINFNKNILKNDIDGFDNDLKEFVKNTSNNEIDILTEFKRTLSKPLKNLGESEYKEIIHGRTINLLRNEKPKSTESKFNSVSTLIYLHLPAITSLYISILSSVNESTYNKIPTYTEFLNLIDNKSNDLKDVTEIDISSSAFDDKSDNKCLKDIFKPGKFLNESYLSVEYKTKDKKKNIKLNESDLRLLNKILEYNENDTPLAKISEEDDDATDFNHTFGIYFSLEKLTNTTGKKFFKRLTKIVQNSTQYINNVEKSSTELGTVIENIESTLDKLEDNESEFKNKIKEKLQDLEQPDSKDKNFTESNDHLKKDLQHIKNLVNSSMTIFEDLIKLCFGSRCSEKTAITLLSLSVIDYYYRQLMDMYIDLISLKNPTNEHKKLMDKIENIIENNFVS